MSVQSEKDSEFQTSKLALEHKVSELETNISHLQNTLQVVQSHGDAAEILLDRENSELAHQVSVQSEKKSELANEVATESKKNSELENQVAVESKKNSELRDSNLAFEHKIKQLEVDVSVLRIELYEATSGAKTVKKKLEREKSELAGQLFIQSMGNAEL